MAEPAAGAESGAGARPALVLAASPCLPERAATPPRIAARAAATAVSPAARRGQRRRLGRSTTLAGRAGAGGGSRPWAAGGRVGPSGAVGGGAHGPGGAVSAVRLRA